MHNRECDYTNKYCSLAQLKCTYDVVLLLMFSSCDRSEQTLDKQAQLLFDIICDRGSLAFGKFVQVLEDSDKYQALGKQLRLDRGGSGTTPDPHRELAFIHMVKKS